MYYTALGPGHPNPDVQGYVMVEVPHEW